LQEEIAQLAPLFFEDQSCRLLHDHVINKPLGNDGVVPWHQDYTYWPVDNPHGLSVWLPFTTLDEHAGVLEVIPKSHQLGEEKPVDFMNDDQDFQEYTSLTVKKGDVVILDALTWHRTSRNTSVKERTAYIALFIPSHATYAPKHAHWHPINDNVTVQEGEVLNDDWFPSIGNTTHHTSPFSYTDNTQNMAEGITMFNASKIVKKFLTHHLPKTQNLNLWHYLYDKVQRQHSTQVLSDRFELNMEATKELDSAMLSLAINGIAYEHHRARNVYNKSYIIFKKLFGNELQLR